MAKPHGYTAYALTCIGKVIIEGICYFITDLSGTVRSKCVGTASFRRTTTILCNHDTHSEDRQQEY